MILSWLTGAAELALVAASGWPPLLPDQPIFCPVTSFDDAEKIARGWTTTRPAPDDLGFVTRLAADGGAAKRHPVQEAGGQAHRELRVPAEELGAFNAGLIEVVARDRDGQRIG